MNTTVQLADYLLIRLKQLGVDSIHGVPGDYNLAFLDYIKPQGIHWVGNCNELNAGYAADAYSRIKGLGALVTTFGVGELSAANAIAGAYAELAPVVHIVGTPARQLQQSRALVHHTLNDGDFRRFAEMHAHITVAQANLEDPRTCPQLIDATIQQCLVHSRPVYIELPADMVSVPVSAARLQDPIHLPDDVSSKDEDEALKLILDRVYSAQRPMILVDGESRAYKILDELHQLITTTQWPTWTTIFGKSCIDESLPNVYGIWKGKFASREEAEYVGSCDLIFCFGPHFSNTNTYHGTSIPEKSVSILFSASTIHAEGKTLRDLPAKRILSTLLSTLDAAKARRTLSVKQVPPTNPTPDPKGRLTQDLFYRAFSDYLLPGDVILAETGTAGHGCREFKLPPGTFLFKPSTWLSIGYMLPATLGAALAQRELYAEGSWSRSHPPRAVLLIGDGSFQMTVQELSTIIKENLNVLLILINNDGYTIERCLHGYNQPYNDIVMWRYLQAPALFGAKEEYVQTARAETWEELHQALKSSQEADGKPMLRMVEVFMGREDAPVTLMGFLNRQKEAAAVK